jgi:hypothetical protein
VIFAFARRTASVLVNFAFGNGFFEASDPPGLGIAGSSGTGIVAPRSMGCMIIGPVRRGLLSCIRDKRVAAEMVRNHAPAPDHFSTTSKSSIAAWEFAAFSHETYERFAPWLRGGPA